MAETQTTEIPRLKARYREEIVPALRSEFDIANVMQVPGLTKIVVNMGVGEAARDSKLIDGAVKDLATITGQKPQVTRSCSRSTEMTLPSAPLSLPAITFTVSPFLIFIFFVMLRAPPARGRRCA